MITTFNPADKHASVTLSNGNLTALGADNFNNYAVRSTTSKNWGLLYCEITVTVGSNGSGPHLGIATSDELLSVYPGYSSLSRGYFPGFGWSYGKLYPNNTDYGPTGANGDVVMLAMNLNAQKMWCGKNGSWPVGQAGSGGDPAAGTSPAFSTLPAGPLFVMASVRGSTVTANFGASAFAYTPPAGFQPWDSDEGNPLREVKARHIAQHVSLHNRYWL